MAIWVCSYIMIHVLQRERERETRRRSHTVQGVHLITLHTFTLPELHGWATQPCALRNV